MFVSTSLNAHIHINDVARKDPPLDSEETTKISCSCILKPLANLPMLSFFDQHVTANASKKHEMLVIICNTKHILIIRTKTASQRKMILLTGIEVKWFWRVLRANKKKLVQRTANRRDLDTRRAHTYDSDDLR